MTADKIVERAALMLGLKGVEEERIQPHALTAVNRIYAELHFLEGDGDFQEISRLSQPVDISQRLALDVMPYGVAALLASAMGDVANQNYFARLYNLKRKRAQKAQIGKAIEKQVIETIEKEFESLFK